MLDYNDIYYYFNSGKSLDLSPIEHIWSVMKKWIKKMKPTNEEELRIGIIRSWHEYISIDLINKCIKTMPQRMRELKKRNGEATR
jgi:transposase